MSKYKNSINPVEEIDATRSGILAARAYVQEFDFAHKSEAVWENTTLALERALDSLNLIQQWYFRLRHNKDEVVY